MSFVLDELEKILNVISPKESDVSKDNKADQPVGSTSPTIMQSDLLSVKRRYLSVVDLRREIAAYQSGGLISAGNLSLPRPDLNKSLKYLSPDDLFASMMRSFVLTRLAQLADRPYPAARLMICDRRSYDYLIKLQLVSLSRKTYFESSASGTRYLLYQNPFSVTAIFLVQDIVDQLVRLKKPLVTLSYDSERGRTMANFDYSIIKQTIPYLRISDLVLVLSDISDFKLYTYNIGGRKDHQVLQYLSHFARSTSIIETAPIVKKLGGQHAVYNNVAVFKPIKQMKLVKSTESAGNTIESNKPKAPENAHLKVPLEHLSYFAYRLIQLAQSLHIQLRSISFRAGDPYCFTKLFAQIVSTSLQSRQNSRQFFDAQTSLHRQARILVLDRFVDLQTILQHTELYGPFLEQELQLSGSLWARKEQDDLDSDDKLAIRVIQSKLSHGLQGANELDCELHLEKITNVLSTIVRFTLDMKPRVEMKTPPKMCPRSPASPTLSLLKPGQPSTELSSIISTHQAINKHLELIKLIYRHLDSGYLLISKLETKALDLLHDLRCLTNMTTDLSLDQPLERHQTELVGKLARLMAAYMKLSKIYSKNPSDPTAQTRPTIKPIDLLRLACILIDLINTSIYIYSAALNAEKSRSARNAEPSNRRNTGASNSSVSRSFKTLENMRKTLLNGKEFNKFREFKKVICGIKRASKSGGSRGYIENSKKLGCACCSFASSGCRALHYCINCCWSSSATSYSTLADREAALAEQQDFREQDESAMEEVGEYQCDESSLNLAEKLAIFDNISRSTCGSRSTQSLFEIIENFYLDTLDENSFPKLTLKPAQRTETPSSPELPMACIVVFLGSLSFDELARLKLLELELKKKRKGTRGETQPAPDIILLSSAIAKPSDFLKSL